MIINGNYLHYHIHFALYNLLENSSQSASLTRHVTETRYPVAGIIHINTAFQSETRNLSVMGSFCLSL